MDMTLLTDEQRDEFNTNGFLIVRNALDDAYRQRLVEAGDKLVASGDPYHSAPEDAREGAAPRHAGYRNIIELDEAFLPLLTMSTTLPLVMQLMGPRLQLHTSHLIWRFPSPEGTPDGARHPGWHRDIGRMIKDIGHDVHPRVEIKVAYYLSDCSRPGCGQTRFARGSHTWREAMQLSDDAVDPDEAVEPLLNPGDAVLFENRTWHAAGPNYSGTRKTIMFGYSYRWIRPDDYVRQPERVLERCSELERSLVDVPENFDASGKFLPGGRTSAIEEWADAAGIGSPH